MTTVLIVHCQSNKKECLHVHVHFPQERHDAAVKEGWEYAPLGSESFHLTEGLFDFTRRRRYIRKLVNEVPGARAVFTFTEMKDKSSGDEERKEQVPHAHMEFKGEETPFWLTFYVIL